MPENSVKGLELARRYFEHCRPSLEISLGELMDSAAFGMAGEGSECFGCDDEISRDHDFGPAFCIWLPANIYEANRTKIAKAIKLLPQEFSGLPTRMFHFGRTGAMTTEGFYSFFTGLDHPPHTWQEWLKIPEEQLAAATNGEVFEDRSGHFSKWREKLEDFYPEDVRLKKLAAAVMRMAQAGQYNLPRSLKRGDGPAALLAAARFAEAALSFVFLVNKRYRPFYKWAPRLARDLPRPAPRLARLLEMLAEHPLSGPKDLGIADEVEDFCGECAALLRRQGLSNEADSWLWAHGPAIAANIENPQIRKLNLLEG